MIFGDKNSDPCLSHELKSFDLKKYWICFLRTEKMVFDNKKTDLFYDK